MADDDRPVPAGDRSGGGAGRAGVRSERGGFTRAVSRGVPLRTLLVIDGLILATGAAVLLAWRLRQLILYLFIGILFAVVLNPAVRWLGRRGVGRGMATTLVFLLGLVAFGAIVYVIVHPIYNAANHFASQLPRYVRDAEHGRGRIGQLIQHYHIQDYVRRNTPKLQSFITSLGHPALNVAKSVLSGIIGVVTVAVLSFFLLLEGPRLLEAMVNQLSEARGARVRRLLHDMSRTVIGYVFGNMLTSFIAGVVVFVALEATGVPFAFVLALWVALVDLLPLVGGLLAGIPTVAIAFIHSIPAGIVLTVVFLVYQQIENHALNPAIMSKTVRLNPLWVLLAVLIGADLAGFIGALLAIPAAGAIQVVVTDLWRNRATRLEREALLPSA
jgi:predicted PurR-regulated permease PerM